MRRRSNPFVVVALSACLLLPLFLGCNSSSSSSSTPLVTIDPPSPTISGESPVVFTASVTEGQELFLPLVWSVDDPSLGNITSSAGLTAIYESSGATGVNPVKVRDQAGSEGVAVVIQE